MKNEALFFCKKEKEKANNLTAQKRQQQQQLLLESGGASFGLRKGEGKLEWEAEAGRLVERKLFFLCFTNKIK